MKSDASLHVMDCTFLRPFLMLLVDMISWKHLHPLVISLRSILNIFAISLAFLGNPIVLHA